MRAKEITSLFHTLLQESCSRCSVLEQELRDLHLCHKAERRALVQQHESKPTFALRTTRRWWRQPRSLLAQTRKFLATHTRPINYARSWQQRSTCGAVGTPEKSSLQRTMKPTRWWRMPDWKPEMCVLPLLRRSLQPPQIINCNLYFSK